MGKYRLPANPKRNSDQRSLYLFLSVVTVFAPLLMSPFSLWPGWGGGSLAIASIGTNSLSDNNNSGRVDIQDYARLASRWEQSSDKYDITGDNYIDVNDLMILCVASLADG